MRMLLLLVAVCLGGGGCSGGASAPAGPLTIEIPPTPAPGAALSVGLAALLPETLVDANGDEVAAETLAGKLVGLYFSAKWCPPCRRFTPSLVDFRDRHHDSFEVVFVSADHDEKAQQDYMRSYRMQWPAVPFGSDAGELQKRYGIRGIPTLVILDADGGTVTASGRADVQSDPDGALDKWRGGGE